MDIASAHTPARTPEEIARRLYAALDAVMGELGRPTSWDVDVEAMFCRQTLERALLALDDADALGYGSSPASDEAPRFLRSV